MYALVAGGAAVSFIAFLYHAAAQFIEAIGLARCDIHLRPNTVLLVDLEGRVRGEDLSHPGVRW